MMIMRGNSHILLSSALVMLTLLAATESYPSSRTSRNDFIKALQRIEDLEKGDSLVTPSELKPPPIINQQQGYYYDDYSDVIDDALYKAYIDELLGESMNQPEPNYIYNQNKYDDNIVPYYYPQYESLPANSDEIDESNAEALFSYLLNYESEIYKFPNSESQPMEEDIPPFAPQPAPDVFGSGNQKGIDGLSDIELEELANWLSQQGNEVYLAALVEYLKQRLVVEISEEESKIKALQDAYVSLIDSSHYDAGVDDYEYNSYVLPMAKSNPQSYYYYDPYYTEDQQDSRRFVPVEEYNEPEEMEETNPDENDSDDLIGLMQMLGINPAEYDAVKQQTQEKEIDEPDGDNEFQDFLMEMVNNLAMKYLDDIVEYEAELEADEQEDYDYSFSHPQEMAAEIPLVDNGYYPIVNTYPEEEEDGGAEDERFGDVVDDEEMPKIFTNDRIEEEPIGAEFWKQLLNELIVDTDNSEDDASVDGATDDWLKPEREGERRRRQWFTSLLGQRR